MSFLFFKNKLTSLSVSGILNGAADCHSHILPGVDDGIQTFEDALAAIELEEKAGVSDLWCTPHIMEDVPNSTESLRARFAELSARYNGPVRLHLGAEYMMDNLLVKRIMDRDMIATGEEDVVMFETRAMNAPIQFNAILTRASVASYRPILAHPERYLYLEIREYKGLRDSGILMQLNLGSLIGVYGPAVRDRALYLLREGFYTCFGTDTHVVKSLNDLYSAEVFDNKTIDNLAKISRR